MSSLWLRVRPARAVGILALLSMLAIALSVVLLLAGLRQRALAASEHESVSLTQIFVRQVEQDFNTVDLILRGVQERLHTSFGAQLPLDDVATQLLLGARVAGSSLLTALFVVDASGNVVNTSANKPVLQRSVAQRAYFTAFARDGFNGLFLGRPLRSLGDHQWSLYLARRLDNADGTFRGIVVAKIEIARLEHVYSLLKLDRERPSAIYLRDGTLLSSIPHREDQIGTAAPELSQAALAAAGDGLQVFSFGADAGAPQRLVLSPVPRFALLAGVQDRPDEALREWRDTALPIGVGALLMVVFIVCAAGLLMYELAREEALTQALRDADARYQQTVDSVMDAIVAVDEDQTIRLFNPSAERMFGVSAAQALGGSLERLMDLAPGVHGDHVRTFGDSQVASRTMGAQLQITGRHASGRVFPVESTISQTVIGGRRQYTAVLRDVTERRRAEAEMQVLNQQLRELSNALLQVREQERTRIARELHDDLGQQLTGLKLDLSWASKRLRDGRSVGTEEMDAMRQLLDTAISSVRRLSAELRPVVLDELGFAEAVRWQCGEVARRSGLDIQLELTDAARVRNEALASALFRIVQEALTNVVRHAAARTVQIRIFCDASGLLLSVQDDGCGLDALAPGQGVGLVSMRERAVAFGGKFSIAGSAGAGTTISVVLPLDVLGPDYGANA